MNDSLLTQMQNLIENWQQAKDRRVIFLQCYQAMTANTLTAVADGRFQDAAWVAYLLNRFADYYFVALAAYDKGQEQTPAIWRYAFAAAHRKRTNVLQHLFLGVNAHINYDLALTLYDVLHEEWPTLTPAQRDGRYRDYCLINEIIAETIDQVQDEVVKRESPLLVLVDWLGGRIDEWLVVEMLTGWREEVWRQGVEMIEAVDADGRATLRQSLEQSCLQRGRRILMA